MVIPERYCVRLLDNLHQEDHGICHMKLLVRGYFGVQDWMLLLLKGFSNVMFVLPWASPLQGHHFTLEMAC